MLCNTEQLSELFTDVFHSFFATLFADFEIEYMLAAHTAIQQMYGYIQAFKDTWS